MRFHPLRLLLVLGALTLAVVAGACGSDENGGGDSFDAIAKAVDRTAGADSMRVAFTAEVAGEQLEGTGYHDLAGRSASMHTEVPGVGGMDIVTDDFVMFMRMPDDAAVDLPDGKEWIRIDLDEALSQQGIDLGTLAQTGGTDAKAQLAQLKAIGDVKEAGAEDVRGVPTTRYSGKLDLEKVPDIMPADQRETARRSMENLIRQTGGESRLPLDLWVGDDGRVHRMRESIPSTNDGRDVEITMEFFDFGAEEEVEVPDPDDTVDLTDVASQAAP